MDYSRLSSFFPSEPFCAIGMHLLDTELLIIPSLEHLNRPRGFNSGCDGHFFSFAAILNFLALLYSMTLSTIPLINFVGKLSFLNSTIP